MEAIGDRVLYSYDQEKWATNSYVSEDQEEDHHQLRILLREFLEERNLGGREREFIEKLIFKFGNDLASVERVLREMLGSRMVEDIISKLNNRGATTGERGLGGIDHASTRELKLERFRVKTVNVIGSGVVKEEEPQQ